MTKEKKNLTFEQKMMRVDEIVKIMDSNDLPLENILNLFTEAQELIKQLEDELKSAKEKVAKYIE